MKLGHNDQWPSPHMSYDPWPGQRSPKVTGVKKVNFYQKRIKSLGLCVAWSCNSCLCITLTYSTNVIRSFFHLRSFGVTGVKYKVWVKISSKIHICHVQYSILKSYAHMEAQWPVLPGLTKIRGQGSFKVISGAWRNGVKWAYLATSEHLEEQPGPS